MSTPDLIALLKRLIDAGVDFVVVGGVAAALHGSTRSTFDLDICMPFETENLGRLIAALQDLQPRHDHPSGRPLDSDPSSYLKWKNLYLITSLGKLDCLCTLVTIGDYQALVAESVQLNLDAVGGRFLVISLAALVREKAALDTPKDRVALKELEAILALSDSSDEH